MNFETLSLIVLAAFVHAGWNFLAKKAATGPLFVWVCSGMTIVLWLPIVFLSVRLEDLPIGGLAWFFIAVSGALHLGYSLVLQAGYLRADLSVVYPVARGSAPLISSVAAILLLGESLSLAGIGGIVLIVAGIFCIAGGRKLFAITETRVRSGLYFGGLTGAFIASYTVFDAYAVKWLLISPILLDYLGNLLRWVFITPTVIRQREQISGTLRSKFWYAAGVGLLSPLSYVLVLYAMKQAPISHVAPAREISMLVAAWLGTKLLNEGNLIQRLSGSVLMVIGVIALIM